MKYRLTMRSLLLFALSICIAFTSAPFAHALETSDYSGQDIFFYSKTATCTASSDSLSGDSNLEKIYNYLIGKGLSDVQAAGAVGNIAIESRGDPTLIQISYQKEFGATHTNDPTPMGTKVGVGRAWGVIQWDAGGRAVEYAKKAGISTPIYELSTQLDLIWWHLTEETPTSRRNFINSYKKTTTVEEATTLYEQGMEGAGHPAMTDRIKAAELALKEYGSGTTGTLPVDSTAATDTTTTSSLCSTGSANGNTIVAIAQAELAKHVREWDSNALKYTDGNKWAWCASFVSWVYKEAGSPFTGGTSGGWLIPAVVNMKAWFQKHGTYFAVGNGEPQPGDVAIYLSQGYSHVNIVETYEDGVMTTIGGNQSDQVTRYPAWKVSTHPMGLIGFGRMT